ncbi:hypothetical protein J2S19_004219 [Metabacillus malikii]|uniref:Uncharacterized protein n=1 Tax=Metabacillus malikii TaxID=1504265 RepID=A0ABT9ZM70_9BACI|nr:hypothetical protein [Metabacillus malikii]
MNHGKLKFIGEKKPLFKTTSQLSIEGAYIEYHRGELN